MRIEINLASQPYQDERQFYTIWGGALAFMVLLTILLLTFAGLRMRDTRQGWRLVDQQRARIKQLQQDESTAIEILNRPENSGTRARSEFLNKAILRKSFSWTAVFADLEKLMPARAHIVSITPLVDADNRLTVKMDVDGETREAAVDLVRSLEKSKHFRFPRLYMETNDQDRSSNRGIRAQIEAQYIPATESQTQPAEGN